MKLRSKENEKAHLQAQDILNLRTPEHLHATLEDLQYPIDTKIHATLFDELALAPWLKAQTVTQGGATLLQRLVEHPTHDTNLLETRQKNVATLSISKSLLKDLKEHEANVLWLLNLPPLKEAYPFPMLFPHWPILSMINHIPIVLALYHIFRTIFAPWMNIFYPLTTVFGPYVYLRKTLKWPISFKAYLNMLRLALTHILRPTGSLHTTITRYVTLIAYVGMFLYGVVQSFDIAIMLRKALKSLEERVKSVKKFVATFYSLTSGLSPSQWNSFLPTSHHVTCVPQLSNTDIYHLWTDGNARNSLKDMLKIAYALDIAHGIKQLSMTRGWCVPTYNESMSTNILSMGHPLLVQKQVRNPLSLDRNLIITGPNAAGKTTYMKAICCNIILAQSIGLVCGLRANMNVVHAIGSFIRVSDTVGKDSLFEAEAKRCSEMLVEAETLVAEGKRAVYFLDEPMHSTPPLEGAATAMTVVKHLGSLQGVRVFATTHYHSMIDLETIEPTKFLNVSMEAIVVENGFTFPYRIRRGASKQCIAIELLREKGFSSAFVESAIEMKNKICRAHLDTSKNASRPHSSFEYPDRIHGNRSGCWTVLSMENDERY